MVITISGTQVQIIGEPDVIFQNNNLVNTLAAVTDKDESWQYNVDIFMPNSNRYNSIIMTRNGNMLSVDLTRQMLPENGRYVFQFRGQSGNAVYHTDKFCLWVKDSIDLNEAYNPMPAEFYQMEAQMKEILKQVQETASETLPEINESTNGQYLSNDGVEAKWADVEAGLTQEQADERYLQLSGGTMAGDIDMGNNDISSVASIKAAGNYENAGIQFGGNGTIIKFITGYSTALELSANNVNVINHGIDNVAELNMTTNGNITKAGLIGGNVNQNNKTCIDFTTTNSIGIWAEGAERVIIDTNGINVENNKITNLAAPVENTDATNKQYVDNAVSSVAETVNDILDGTETLPYLPDNGGTLTGALNMGNNKITMGATPTATTDVTNKGYVDGVVKVVSDEVDGIIAGTTPISVPIATDTKVGGVLQAAGVTDATNADDIITQFNALLASLRTSGVLQDNT